MTRDFDVVIVGAGPAGIGAALALSSRGIDSVCLIERSAAAGGIPARYGDKGPVPTFVAYRRGSVVHGGEYARALRERLARTRVRVMLETQVIGVDVARRTVAAVAPDRGRFEVTARACVFTTGAREQSAAERGWMAGARPARVLFTLQLIDLLERHDALPGARPIVLGSDLIGYAAAAKLAAAGAEVSVLADTSALPRTSLPARLFFRRWTRARHLAAPAVRILGDTTVESVSTQDHSLSCDAVVLSGSLTPNSELLVQGGFRVEPPRQVPAVSRSGVLSEPGFFAAGNLLGGFHGAEWCYRSGRRVGSSVAKYLIRENS